jgi:hypothetical protein
MHCFYNSSAACLSRMKNGMKRHGQKNFSLYPVIIGVEIPNVSGDKWD